MRKGQRLFPQGHFPDSVAHPAMLASVGIVHQFVSDFKLKMIRTNIIVLFQCQPTIGLISTGDELIESGQELRPGKIYDSNTVMLKELLHRFGYTDIRSVIAGDRYALAPHISRQSFVGNFL